MITGNLRNKNNFAYTTINGKLPDEDADFKGLLGTYEQILTDDEKSQVKQNLGLEAVLLPEIVVTEYQEGYSIKSDGIISATEYKINVSDFVDVTGYKQIQQGAFSVALATTISFAFYKEDQSLLILGTQENFPVVPLDPVQRYVKDIVFDIPEGAKYVRFHNFDPSTRPEITWDQVCLVKEVNETGVPDICMIKQELDYTGIYRSTLNSDATHTQELYDIHKYPQVLSWGHEYLFGWYQKLFNATDNQLTVVVTGDSTTYEASWNEGTGRVDGISKIFKDGGFENVDIINDGFGSTCTAHWVGAWELGITDTENPPCNETLYPNGLVEKNINQTPDLLLWNFGINDPSTNIYPGASISEKVEYFKNNLIEGLQRIRGNVEVNGRPAYNKSPDDLSIILFTPFNVNNASTDKTREKFFRFVRPIIQEACREYKCAYFDLSECYYDTEFTDIWSIVASWDPSIRDDLHPEGFVNFENISRLKEVLLPNLYEKGMVVRTSQQTLTDDEKSQVKSNLDIIEYIEGEGIKIDPVDNSISVIATEGSLTYAQPFEASDIIDGKLTITHDRNTKAVVVEVYSATGESYLPTSVTPISDTVVEIVLGGSITSGSVVIIGGTVSGILAIDGQADIPVNDGYSVIHKGEYMDLFETYNKPTFTDELVRAGNPSANSAYYIAERVKPVIVNSGHATRDEMLQNYNTEFLDPIRGKYIESFSYKSGVNPAIPLKMFYSTITADEILAGDSIDKHLIPLCTITPIAGNTYSKYYLNTDNPNVVFDSNVVLENGRLKIPETGGFFIGADLTYGDGLVEQDPNLSAAQFSGSAGSNPLLYANCENYITTIDVAFGLSVSEIELPSKTETIYDSTDLEYRNSMVQSYCPLYLGNSLDYVSGKYIRSIDIQIPSTYNGTIECGIKYAASKDDFLTMGRDIKTFDEILFIIYPKAEDKFNPTTEPDKFVRYYLDGSDPRVNIIQTIDQNGYVKIPDDSFFGYGNFVEGSSIAMVGYGNILGELGTSFRDLVVSDPHQSYQAIFSPSSQNRIRLDTIDIKGDVGGYSVPKIQEIEERISALEKSGGGGAQETYRYKERPADGIVTFSVMVNNQIADVDAQTTTLQDSGEEVEDWGVLYLPTNYTRDGSSIRLLILVHGDGTWISENDKTINTLVPEYLSQGFAVVMMNGMPNGVSGESNDRSFGAPFALYSNVKGYQWVLDNYNISKDGCFVAGASMGGLASFQLPQMTDIPVLAQVAFCPVIDLYKQAYCKPWRSTPVQREKIAEYFGFSGTAPTFTTGHSPTSEEIEYFQNNVSKWIGFNPILNNVTNLNLETYFRTLPTTNTESNVEEANDYNTFTKTYHCPLKIWHNTDDGTVAYRYSKYIVDMINRSGGQAYLRTFTSGGHDAWSNGDNVTVKDVDNNDITMQVSTYESILFMNRYR